MTTGFESCSSANAVIYVEHDQFLKLLKEANNPLVVYQKPNWLQRQHRYLLNHRGMTFYTKSSEELSISKYTEVIEAKQIHTSFCM